MARRGEPRFVDWQAAGPWLAIAVALFYLNDLAFLNASGYRSWLAIDYATRLLVLAALFAPASLRAPLRAELGGVPGVHAFVGVTIGAAVVGIATDALRGSVLAIWPNLGGISFPAPDSPPLHAFDLTVGIGFVALSEELTFRAPLLLLVREGRIGRIAGLIVTSLVFGAMHWSFGLDNVVAATAAGLVFGTATLVTRSLWPAIVAHYIVDAWHFL
ncbi:MAG: type II CAAX endopeptidase family protein [Alphaproteobacteria bacterium]